MPAVQQAAAYAFTEPAVLAGRIHASRRMHAHVARAVAGCFATAGVATPAPQAAFYLYPDFAPHRRHLLGLGVGTSGELAGLLLGRYHIGVLPGSAFGDPEDVLRVRVATSLLYGRHDAQREAALASPDPAVLPWIRRSLTQLNDALTDLPPPVERLCRSG